ncbi:hypothetical protein [Spongiimicrobium salis]|uniref:hypothetical protein n=1 Tax=Spongiimicrobium salis TaxID=1667022 RepID=UPI00374DA29D
MKYSIYIAIVLMMGLSSCASQKKLETAAPFKMGSASSQAWTGGVESSGSGYTLKVAMEELSPNVEFRDIYFRGQIGLVEMEEVDGKMYCKAKLIKKAGKPDIISHKDAAKEAGNQPPALNTSVKKQFPFEVNKDEAVLRYTEGNKTRYIKISNIKELAPKVYSGIQKN